MVSLPISAQGLAYCTFKTAANCVYHFFHAQLLTEDEKVIEKDERSDHEFLSDSDKELVGDDEDEMAVDSTAAKKLN